MKDSIYVLAKEDLKVEKFHFCTWDVRNMSTFVEVGLSLANNESLPERVILYLVLPFVDENCQIRSHHETLNDSDNYKFIFNEIPESVNTIDGEKRNGSIVKLSGKGAGKPSTHQIANASAKIDNNLPIVLLEMDKPAAGVEHLYARILIQTRAMTIAEEIRGIAKRSYIFDVKINEARNIPSPVLDYKRSHHLDIVSVEAAYCLHCVPDNYEISFSDAKTLMNIRRLEKEAFQHYLPILERISGDYIITFNKHSTSSGSYSFFTSFNKEVVGDKQLLVAVVTNLICNLLFAIAAFRVVRTRGTAWYRQIPVEWWIAVGVIVFGLVMCLPIKMSVKRIFSKKY